MAILYLTEQQAWVALEGDCLIVHIPERDPQGKPMAKRERKMTIPLFKVEEVMVLGEITITTPALARLLEARVPVTYLSKYGHYLGGLNPILTKNSILRLAQHSAYADGARRHARLNRKRRAAVAGSSRLPRLARHPAVLTPVTGPGRSPGRLPPGLYPGRRDAQQLVNRIRETHSPSRSSDWARRCQRGSTRTRVSRWTRVPSRASSSWRTAGPLTCGGGRHCHGLPNPLPHGEHQAATERTWRTTPAPQPGHSSRPHV